MRAKSQKSSILRILDANYNRAKEGVRVCEDVARFVLENRRLTGRFKTIRHDLTKVMLNLPVTYSRIVAERDVRKDVGSNSLKLDKKKIISEDIFASNVQRSQEAVRVLEEWSKIISIPAAKKFQKIRFSLYELEKETFKQF